MKTNKIIDFHGHCFSDALAKKAIGNLSDRARIMPYTDGTLKSTLEVMDLWNTDYMVIHNIAVTPRSVSKVNDYAISINGDRIISFGSVHPNNKNWIEELERLRAAGIRGIKIHPEYQNFMADNAIAMDIYKKCGELNLAVLLHCGWDVAYDNSYRGGGITLNNMAKKCSNTRFVFAHLGGFRGYRETIKHIEKLDNVWLDTAFVVRGTDKDVFLKIANNFGVDRILYATDCPWESGIITQNYIDSLGFSSSELAKIYYNNAINVIGEV